jgi:acylaminoacyl-peptidase
MSQNSNETPTAGCGLGTAIKVNMVDAISRQFVELLAIPSPTAARFIDQGESGNANFIQFAVDWSATDVVKKEKVGFTKIYTILKDSLNQTTVGVGGVLKNVIESPPIVTNGDFTTTSLSGSKKAVVSNKKTGEPKEGELLQIFNKQSLVKTYDLKELDKHGVIYSSPLFGSTMSFSPDETKLMYLAEAKVEKRVPFFTSFGKAPELDWDGSGTDAGTGTDKPKVRKGEEYEYLESWGEKMQDSIQSVIVVLNIENDFFQVSDLSGKDLFPSDLQWVNNDNIIGVGYTNTRKLGLAVCSNRKSRIFSMKADGSNFNYLSNADKAAFSPRVRPDGKFVIWQERIVDGPHQRAREIIGLDLVQNGKPYTLYKSNPSNMIPIYEDFPQRCWSPDGRKFNAVTPSGVEMVHLSFSVLEENALIEPNVLRGGVGTFLCVGENFILGSQSTRDQGPSLVLVDTLNDDKIYRVTEGVQLMPLPLKRLIIKGSASPPSFYYGPSGEDHSIPLVVCVHGGPHCSYVDMFSPEVGLLLQRGFGVLHVNYAGSTGGETDITDTLCGKVGKLDLVDSYNITQSLLDQEKTLDSKNIFVFGGSHGGFLGAHLMAAYPDFYKAAVLLNPVTDLAAMVASTDIPDWCYAEAGAGQEYTQNDFLPYVRNLDDAKKFMECSPIQNASKVKGATLLLLGNQDLRVPMSQGLAYYKTLKSFNKETEVRVYNDNHSLYKVPCRLDVMIHSALWFCTRLKK